MTIGIYRIDGPKGKIYIGSSKDIERRWYQHRNGYSSNQKLTRAINKYGIERFVFSVLETVDDETRLAHFEQIWLDILFDAVQEHERYNIQKTSGNNGGIKLTDEHKQSISKALKGKTPKNIDMLHSDEAATRRKQTMKNSDKVKEHLENLRQSAKGKPRTQQVKDAVSKARAKTYLLVSPEGVLTEITNLAKFCKEHGYSHAPLALLVTGKRNTAYGWTLPK